MSVTADLPDEDIESSLGKRKRDPTTRYNPSDGVSAAGPSKKPSKRRIRVDEELLDDLSPSKALKPTSVREMLQKVFLDLKGDEDDDLVEMVNNLGSLASFNKEQKLLGFFILNHLLNLSKA